MKKLLVFLVLLIALGSCIKTPSEIENLTKIEYFRDTRTGLCYATITSWTELGYIVRSITCVPCDSLKNVVTTDTSFILKINLNN